jgi:hypothetical protein
MSRQNTTLRKKFEVLTRWISINSLSLGLAFALAGWLEGVCYPPTLDFDLSSPSLLGSLFAGFVLGVVQWLQIKNQGMSISFRWILGATLGVFFIAQIGLTANNLATWSTFNEPSSFSGSLRITIDSSAVSGLIGGAILGVIQGWRIRVRLIWGVTNALAWSIAWGAGRGAAYFVDYWGYWRLQNLSIPVELAIHLGIVGFVSGLISSVITGVVLLRLIRRSSAANDCSREHLSE